MPFGMMFPMGDQALTPGVPASPAAPATPAAPKPIDPNILAQLLGMGSEKEKALQRQLATAEALRNPQQGQYRTGWGAALGGLGDLLGAYRGAKMEQKAQGELEALGKQRTDARSALAKGLLSPETAEQYAQLGILSGDQGMGALGGRILEEKSGERKSVLTQARELERLKQEQQFAKEQQGRQLEAHAAEGKAERELRERLEGDKAAREKLSADVKAAEDLAKETTDLRKEFSAKPEVKQFNDASVAYEKAKASAKAGTRIGDVALLYNYMKLIDPGAIVTEGDQANVSKTGSVPGHIVQLYNEAVNGQLLNPQKRAEIIDSAKSQYVAHANQYAPLVERFRGLATKRGITPEDVALPFAPPTEPPPQKSTAPTTTAHKLFSDKELAQVDAMKKQGMNDQAILDAIKAQRGGR